MQTTRPTYQQVYGMVMQLSPDDRMRLRDSLYDMEEDDVLEPYTEAELSQMMKEGLEAYRQGRCCTAEEGWRKLEEEFPWLKD